MLLGPVARGDQTETGRGGGRRHPSLHPVRRAGRPSGKLHAGRAVLPDDRRSRDRQPAVRVGPRRHPPRGQRPPSRGEDGRRVLGSSVRWRRSPTRCRGPIGRNAPVRAPAVFPRRGRVHRRARRSRTNAESARLRCQPRRRGAARARRLSLRPFRDARDLDSEHPELSGLVLSLVDRKGEPQDGFLRGPRVIQPRSGRRAWSC